MIQRIQTIYLLIIVALMTATFFFPVVDIQSGDSFYTLDVLGLNPTTNLPELVAPIWALTGITVIIILVALIAIFLYKKRPLQIRLCVFNALLLIGFYGLTAYITWKIYGQANMLHFTSQIALGFPLVSLILDYLAIRKIRADESLIRSLERLR